MVVGFENRLIQCTTDIRSGHLSRLGVFENYSEVLTHGLCICVPNDGYEHSKIFKNRAHFLDELARVRIKNGAGHVLTPSSLRDPLSNKMCKKCYNALIQIAHDGSQ